MTSYRSTAFLALAAVLVAAASAKSTSRPERLHVNTTDVRASNDYHPIAAGAEVLIGGLARSVFIGIIVTIVVVVLLIIACCICCCRACAQKKETHTVVYTGHPGQPPQAYVPPHSPQYAQPYAPPYPGNQGPPPQQKY
ncbi:uncharacterized protein LOC144165738 [Haemaphysalis longicornis]